MLAGAAIAVALAGSAMAQDKKILAVVVKGLDNPFFTVMGQGCADWNTAHADSEYTCLYTGPALSAPDEAGEVQIVQDLISKGVAGIAISPSNAPAMANMLKAAAPTMSIITVDADLLPEDKALRKTYFGTNNHDMGVGMATELKKLKPEGGTVCLQLGNVAAANINERAAGFRDTIAGDKGTEKPEQHQRLDRSRWLPDLLRTATSPLPTSRWPTSSPRSRPRCASFSSAAGPSSARRPTPRTPTRSWIG